MKLPLKNLRVRARPLRGAIPETPFHPFNSKIPSPTAPGILQNKDLRNLENRIASSSYHLSQFPEQLPEIKSHPLQHPCITVSIPKEAQRRITKPTNSYLRSSSSPSRSRPAIRQNDERYSNPAPKSRGGRLAARVFAAGYVTVSIPPVPLFFSSGQFQQRHPGYTQFRRQPALPGRPATPGRPSLSPVDTFSLHSSLFPPRCVRLSSPRLQEQRDDQYVAPERRRNGSYVIGRVRCGRGERR